MKFSKKLPSFFIQIIFFPLKMTICSSQKLFEPHQIVNLSCWAISNNLSHVIQKATASDFSNGAHLCNKTLLRTLHFWFAAYVNQFIILISLRWEKKKFLGCAQLQLLQAVFTSLLFLSSCLWFQLLWCNLATDALV